MSEGVSRGLGYRDAEQVTEIATWCLREYNRRVEIGKQRSGFYVTVMDQFGSVLYQALIGELTAEKAMKYKLFSLEKANRLKDHPDHVSSFQTRNPEINAYGGAVRGSIIGILISISGLPDDKDDEAYAAFIGVRQNWLTPGDAGEILKVSDNQIFKTLH